MRNISFRLTEEQLVTGRKTVTRRTAWETLKPGEVLQAVRQAMGLKRGEAVIPLAVIKVVSVRRERLDVITQEDVIAEGFPDWTPQQFIEFFCKSHRIDYRDRSGLVFRSILQNVEAGLSRSRQVVPSDLVTRIEFTVIPGTITLPPGQVSLSI